MAGGATVKLMHGIVPAWAARVVTSRSYRMVATLDEPSVKLS